MSQVDDVFDEVGQSVVKKSPDGGSRSSSSRKNSNSSSSGVGGGKLTTSNSFNVEIKKRKVWTEVESEALRSGMAAHGHRPNKWARIKADSEFQSRLNDRSGQQLKDRWRNVHLKIGGKTPYFTNVCFMPEALLGQSVRKQLVDGHVDGEVTMYVKPHWEVTYADGAKDHLDQDELLSMLYSTNLYQALGSGFVSGAGGKRRDANPPRRFKSPRKSWTEDEFEALRSGMAAHGHRHNKWARIKADSKFELQLADRSGEQLKDRWRNSQRKIGWRSNTTGLLVAAWTLEWTAADCIVPEALLGQSLRKQLEDGCIDGVVTSYADSYWEVTYVDGEKEDLDQGELLSLLNSTREEALRHEEDALGATVGEDCPICLDTVTMASTRSLRCAHVFHVACVAMLRTFKLKRACPVCRTSLPPGPGKLHERASLRYMVVARKVTRGKTSWGALTMIEKRDIDAALLEWHAAADQGLVQAQYVLGCMYCQGHVVARSYVVAKEWYLKAAHQGDAEAQYAIGIMFQQGHGVAQSDEEAARWFSTAADKRRRNAVSTCDIRQQHQAIAKEELSGDASPDASCEGVALHEATAEAESSPLPHRISSANTAADVTGETGGIVVAEEKDNYVAVSGNNNVYPLFITERPAAVLAASSMAESVADVAIEDLAHQEGMKEFPDGSVYVGQLRNNDRGETQFHGHGRK
jgi:hypothetical protein